MNTQMPMYIKDTKRIRKKERERVMRLFWNTV